MALVGYDPVSQFAGAAQYAIHGFIGSLFGMPLTAEIEPWMKPGSLTRQIPGSKLINDINIPIHMPGLQRFDGQVSFEGRSNIFVRVRRGTYKKGSKINTISGAEVDLGAWTMAPATMNTEIANNPSLLGVALLNGAYTGIPVDAGGTPLGFPELNALDQIYGGKMAVLDTDTSNFKLANPAQPGVGTPWWTARQNVAINPANIIAALKNHQIRQAMNGVELGLGRQGVELWVPYLNEEEARLLTEVMQQLAGSGVVSAVDVTYLVDTLGSPQTNQQVIYGSQNNPVFGRVKVVPIHGMRSDLWCIVSPPPANRPEFAIFLHAFGGANGSYAVNPDGFDGDTNESVPHIALFTFDKNSAIHVGIPGVSAFGDIGILALVNEGVSTQSPLLIDYNYTGAAS